MAVCCTGFSGAAASGVGAGCAAGAAVGVFLVLDLKELLFLDVWKEFQLGVGVSQPAAEREQNADLSIYVLQV